MDQVTDHLIRRKYAKGSIEVNVQQEMSVGSNINVHSVLNLAMELSIAEICGQGGK